MPESEMNHTQLSCLFQVQRKHPKVERAQKGDGGRWRQQVWEEILHSETMFY